MKKLRNLYFTRALAGATALAVLAGVFFSAVLAVVNTQTAKAQVPDKDYSFTWRNAGAIVSGNKIYYDSNPTDKNKTYANPVAGRCKSSTTGIDIPNDRIYADSMQLGRHFSVDATKEDGLGRPTCEETNFPVTASNPNYAKVMLYRNGDNLVRYDGKTIFVKQDVAVNQEGTTNGELFLRVGENGEDCPDIVVHGTNGRYNGWFIIMMGNEDAEYTYGEGHNESPEYNRLKVGKAGVTCLDARGETEGILRLFSLVVNPTFYADIDFVNYAFEDTNFVARKFAMGVPDISQAGPPPGAEPPSEATDTEEGPETACDISFNFATALGFKWIVCPFVNILLSTISWLEDFLTSQLVTETDGILESNTSYHAVWGSFRTLALGIIVVVALVMVIFEAMGVEAFSAYTVRTLFTRFGVAVLFIVLSWSILVEVVVIVNAITEGARTIIYSQFTELEKGDLGGGASFMLLLLGTGGILALGPWGLLSFVLTAVLAIFITVMVLVLVHSLIYILIMVSPVAIALSVLPNTRKVYDIWKNGLGSMFLGLILVAFAMPALDVVAQSTYTLNGGSTLHQIIALILKFMRVFVILFIFSRVGGMLGTISGMVNDRSRGAFDRLKKFRSNTMSDRHKERMDGGKVFGSERLGGAYHRTANIRDGGLSPMARGRARYEAAHERHQAGLRAKRLEEDHGRGAGNDDANQIASQNGMNRQRFIEEYTARTGKSSRNAEKALAELEANYGTDIGTQSFQATAWAGLNSSKTAYFTKPPTDAQGNAIPETTQQTQQRIDGTHREAFVDAAHQVLNGSMSVADAAATIKSNRNRPEFAGLGHGDAMGQIERTMARIEKGETDQAVLVRHDEINKLKDAVLDGTNPSAIVGQRKETVAVMAPRMLERVQNALVSQDQEVLQRELASIAGYKDAMNQIAPQNAVVMSEQVTGKTVMVNGQPMYVQQLLESYQNGINPVTQANTPNQEFTNMRREYTQRNIAQGQAQLVAQGQQAGGFQQPPPTT